jgi:hypothetical protein
VPHPSVLRVRIFFDAQSPKTILPKWRPTFYYLQLQSKTPISWDAAGGATASCESLTK